MVRYVTTSLCITFLALIAGCGSSEPAVATSAHEAKASKLAISTPTLSQGGATQTSVDVVVTAGATGLPAGFSLQWMTAADYAANGSVWYASDDLRLCKASFSGNANLSRYDLAAGEAVTVTVGEFLFDNGASADCMAALTCGTDYVVRAFGHATSTQTRSAFTPNLTVSTLACGSTGACTLTQGYWGTHGFLPTGNNENTWGAVNTDGLTLGTVSYTAAQLQSIFDAPASGNGLIALAHQLIAAKLNALNGADTTAVATAMADADTLIGGLVVPPVGSGYLAPSVTGDLTATLGDYNEGAIGPGHCQ